MPDLMKVGGRHRLAQCRRSSRGRLDSDVEPPFAEASAHMLARDVDRALARSAGFAGAILGPSHRDHRRHGHRTRAGSWTRMERGRGREISCAVTIRGLCLFGD